jgi:adenylosuccinate synthase
VLRAYATRHGAGPFPTESSAVPESPTREHNVEGPWQGRFRSGWFDAVLGRYALAAAGAAHGLAVTHLDQVPRGGAWPYAVAHDLGSEPSPTHFDVAAGSGHARDVRPGPPRDLAHVEAIGKALLAARPVLAQVESERAVATIEEMLDVPVVLESDGPTAEAKRLRG